MKVFETSVTNFRGIISKTIGRLDFTRLFSDFFDSILYKQIDIEPREFSVDKSYVNNRDFWLDAMQGNHFQEQRISLHKFHLTEWLPSSPGRYYTRSAETSRREASKYIRAIHPPPREGVSIDVEFIPLGKQRMVLGGIGSNRLEGKKINSTLIYFLGASSTGISHQGIPVAMDRSNYRSVIKEINKYGGCQVNLTGSLRVLPTNLSMIRYDRKIPRFCFFADEIELVRPSTQSELMSTIAIMFPTNNFFEDPKSVDFIKDDYSTKLTKMWSFCSFTPRSKQNGLNSAVDWLVDYAKEYSGLPNPPILNEFDELYRHFENPVEFSFSDLNNGEIDLERFNAYITHYEINLNAGNIVMGDAFRDIKGSTIVSRSTVIGSFNTVQEKFGSGAVEILKIIEGEIKKTGNSDAVELYKGFKEELEKPEPRKSILNNIWDGIVEVAPTIVLITGLVAKVKMIFGL